MDGDGRREEILQMMKRAGSPLSGSVLAQKMGVSRQVIVQDIALLRAVNKNILSTNKGYVLYEQQAEGGRKKKTMKVKHKDSDIQDELYTIVDCGGRVRDVVVEHPIYGQIIVDLLIDSRMDVDDFIAQVEKYKTKPLNNLTNGVHFHTIESESEKTLCIIEQKLREKGYLCDEILQKY